MKSRVSSLNPYAASFVPLAKQKTNNGIETSNRTRVGSYSDETETPPCRLIETSQNQIPGSYETYNSEAWTQEGHRVPGLYDSKSSIPNGMTEKQYLDEASEMDLAYLATLFPGLSDQSRAYVYSSTGDDVDAAVDMLKQLEDPAEYSQHLPDTLNIGDVPLEFRPTADITALRLSEPISVEASGSSSTSSSPSNPP